MDVSIVIVSYNVRDRLAACLRSIGAGLDGHSFEVVVVDNDSADSSADLVESAFPSARLIRAGGNLGFAAAVNLGAATATGDDLVLLNPDTVVHKGAVSRLVEAARARPGHPAYGGRTVLPDGTPDLHCAWGLPSLWSTLCFGLGLTIVFRGSRWFDPESLAWRGREVSQEVAGLSGSFLLVPRATWEALGGFDPRYFMYSEDADLCLRGAALTGRPPLLVAEATVTHASGASSGNHAAKTVLVLAGRATYIDKHWHGTRRRAGLTLLRLGVGVRAALARVVGRRASTRQRSWVAVWRDRRRWQSGYGPAGAP